jgi:Uma2 family endonuclease
MLACVAKSVMARRPRQGRWTYDDYRHLPEDGLRHEVLDGRHCVSPAPDIGHQLLCTGLTMALGQAAAARGHAVVLTAPVDVRLGLRTVLQPDVMVLRGSASDIADSKFLARAPELVVEVLSKRTAKRDRGAKFELYRGSGVLEYWLVDTKLRVVDAWDFTQDAPAPVRATERVRSTAFPGLVIDLRPFWRQLGSA